MSQPPYQPPASADDALRRIDDDVRAAQARARQATMFRQTLDSLRAEASVHGVTVTIDSSGVLRDLQFPTRVDRVDRAGSDLREDVLTALRQAQQQVAQSAGPRQGRLVGL